MEIFSDSSFIITDHAGLNANDNRRGNKPLKTQHTHKRIQKDFLEFSSEVQFLFQDALSLYIKKGHIMSVLEYNSLSSLYI